MSSTNLLRRVRRRLLSFGRADLDTGSSSSVRPAPGLARTANDAEPLGAGAAARVLFVPEDIVLTTWRTLRPTAEAECEGVVFWAAPKEMYTSANPVITTVIAPAQRVSPGRFELSPDSIREMGRRLRRHGLVNLVQVHTHPGRGVGHSEWDDTHVFSQREGTLSIVWPGYAREIPPLCSWGVHERQRGTWSRLPSSAVQSRVRILPLVIDLRIGLELFAVGVEA